MVNSGIFSQELSPALIYHRSIERSSDIYRSIFEQSGICVVHLDPKLRISEVNGPFSSQIRSSPADILGREILDYLHPSMRENFRREFARLADGRTARFADQVIAVDSQGEPFQGELTGIAVSGSAGGQVDTIVVLLRPRESENPKVASARHKLFSPVHAHILEGVAVGESTVQMASRLFLSRGGVDYHVASLLRKMKVANRPALISKGYALGVFAVGEWPPRVRPEFISP
ncbi:LuxR C-terminal-related transcriptional regulator [Streptomyces sp. NPDC094038]|uniref:LuxR C-terminal-related transcriptional regulator n=1 Tax=Streptomyces sp. NPDC094038 TaxID=3366055 RepID=UPI003826A898